MVRGIRGAITVEEDTPEAIHQATRELLLKMLEANGIQSYEELAAVIFTRVDAAIKTRAQTDILNAFDQEGIDYIWPGILQKEVCRQMLKHGCLLHDLPVHTNVANIQNAIDNIQAVLTDIVKRIT